jgi:hypothetical protein
MLVVVPTFMEAGRYQQTGFDSCSQIPLLLAGCSSLVKLLLRERLFYLCKETEVTDTHM